MNSRKSRRIRVKVEASYIIVIQMEQNWRDTRRWISPMVKNYMRLDIIILDAMILRIVNETPLKIKKI